jgi:hypothetical protein
LIDDPYLADVETLKNNNACILLINGAKDPNDVINLNKEAFKN